MHLSIAEVFDVVCASLSFSSMSQCGFAIFQADTQFFAGDLPFLPPAFLGQGNILTSVCQEFCSRGVVPRPGGCLFPGGCLVPGDAWSWGCVETLPPEQLLLLAVRILLECILVCFCCPHPTLIFSIPTQKLQIRTVTQKYN